MVAESPGPSAARTGVRRRRTDPRAQGISADRPKETRASKACDVCRVRRTKCSGGSPCLACVDNDSQADCRYRARARPSRAKPYLAAVGDVTRYISPLTTLEDEISSWQASQVATTSSLKLPTRPSVDDFNPQHLSRFVPIAEETLINHFFHTFGDHFHYLDSEELLNIHDRFRLAPLSVTSDLLALLRACLCAASSSLAGPESPTSTSGHSKEARTSDALAYYRIARDDLQSWNKASIPALWALHLLIGYCMGSGSPQETRSLVQLMCDWAVEMRLSHKDTACLYPDRDGVHQLFLSCFYFDSLIAGIGDSPPCLLWGGFELDMTSLGSHPATTIQVAVFESELLSMYHQGKMPSIETALELETKWSPHMRTIRMLSNTIHVEDNVLAYANIRFSWLLILLRVPFLKHSSCAASSLSAIARAAAHILGIYTRMASVSRYQPTWPQLRRLITCGQILVLNWNRGDAIFAESKSLYEMFQLLLRLHIGRWPGVEELCKGFDDVATLYGWISIPSAGVPGYPSLDVNMWDEWLSVLGNGFAPT